jgi:poly(3-hydroxybutyrate) depolymerase
VSSGKGLRAGRIRGGVQYRKRVAECADAREIRMCTVTHGGHLCLE